MLPEYSWLQLQRANRQHHELLMKSRAGLFHRSEVGHDPSTVQGRLQTILRVVKTHGCNMPVFFCAGLSHCSEVGHDPSAVQHPILRVVETHGCHIPGGFVNMGRAAWSFLESPGVLFEPHCGKPAHTQLWSESCGKSWLQHTLSEALRSGLLVEKGGCNMPYFSTGLTILCLIRQSLKVCCSLFLCNPS